VVSEQTFEARVADLARSAMSLPDVLAIAREADETVKALTDEIRLYKHRVQQHAEAAAIFQPGGALHKEADLPLGASCVVDGIAWLVKERDALRRQVETLTAERKLLNENYVRKVDECRDEYKRAESLKAEVETLRAAVQAEIDLCAEAFEFVGKPHECERCQRLRAALPAPPKAGE
jgi:phage host-nuclease inhibitor protein Gam